MIPLDFQGLTAVFMGDSITIGGFIDPAYRWSTQLVQVANGIEDNHGVSGSTLMSTINNYNCGRDWFKIANVPTKTSLHKYIFMAYGTNDILINRDEMNVENLYTQYSAAIDAIVGKGWPSSSIVIVNGYWIPNLGISYGDCGVTSARTREEAEAFIETINQVAKDKHCILADTYTDTKNNTNYTTVDGLHPNADGHAIIKTYLANMDYTAEGLQGLVRIKGRNFINI